MTDPNGRICTPLSNAELQRRWSATRKRMEEEGVDALVVQGANSMTGGGAYLRWLTGLVALSSQPQAVIVPKEGLMTLVGHGPLNEESTLDGTNPESPGVGRRVSTPSFPSVGYTGRYDAELLAREIKRGGFRTVGLVGPNNMYYGPISQMQALVGSSAKVIDATDLVDGIIAIKSDEEIALIRRTADMQDKVFAKVRKHIRPGMKDFEVMAYAQYEGQLLGSETGYYLGCSAAPGQPLGHRTRPYQGREICEGDLFMWQSETTGPGGYFVHLARIFALGKIPQDIADVYGALMEAQQYTMKLLKPGASSSEIFKEYNAYMKARGLPEESRLHCHGQGYPSVERPLVRFDETMPIAARMNMGIHPCVANKQMFVTLCDNFLTHADGTVERLHKCPQEIVAL